MAPASYNDPQPGEDVVHGEVAFEGAVQREMHDAHEVAHREQAGDRQEGGRQPHPRARQPPGWSVHKHLGNNGRLGRFPSLWRRSVSSMSRRNTSKNMEVGNGLSWRGSRGSTAVLVVDPSRPGTEEGGARSGVERLDREGVVSASWRGDPCLRHSTNERAILVGGGTD